MFLLPQFTKTTEFWYMVCKAAIKAADITGHPTLMIPQDIERCMEAKRIKELNNQK